MCSSGRCQGWRHGFAPQREALKASFLLSTLSGHPVTTSMLNDRWVAAREKAARNAKEECLEDFAAQFLRHMRKRSTTRFG